METISTISITAIIVGLVELAKKAGLPSRFAPLLAVALGLGIALLSEGLKVEAVLVGIVVGLSASGLYSGVKAVAGN